ncbi:hypothetical protein PR202_gb17834 [Eleusine coracana subsp. coracana]|uniref:Succinate dehydrogenase assembly factor 4, mitochondrial n=1 Tax=Eleusine coracana subsp. coracana TaxID=191504 RepID=A0AAV5F1Q4_ELECO|nr:hypothetical protein QOZ80_6BG0461740 [Eleusine coracana subsp. coracana]GJN29594.1 hypothetical protein PR202_gb17834 [Eleusine coracana subsp. coracana]
MSANHCLRRLASASASALSRPAQPPPPAATLLLRHALSSSAPSTDPPRAPAEAEAAEKQEGEEAAAGAKGGEADAGNDGDAEDDGGGHVNKATGEIGGPRGPEPTRYERLGARRPLLRFLNRLRAGELAL